MAQKSGPPPIVYILAFLLLAGGGYWYFFMRNPNQPGSIQGISPTSAPSTGGTGFSPPASVPSGTTVRIDGSTSMVTINESLKKGFQAQFPGTTVATAAKGSDNGIQALVAGSVDVAALSRPLSASESGQGLVAVPITKDSIAVMVSNTNPFGGGLTNAQVADIFQGKINNWSAVGGPAVPIRVINRPAVSGTHQAFKELVLKGANFGTTPNITTLPQDATTPLIQALGKDGIGYATYAQASKQSTVRILPIDGVTPGASNYPYQRDLSYVYKNPPSPAVQAFIGYATSPQGQLALAAGN